MKPELSIVMPCYNESRNLPVIVENLSKYYPKVDFELLLVNNGSTDDSAVVLEGLAKQYKFIKIITIKKNIGYGHGIMTGLNAASADILSYTHADIQASPEDVIKAYYILKDGQLDAEKVLIKGLRINRAKDQMFLTRYLAKVVGMVLGYEMEDINGQPKLFSRKLLMQMKNPPLDFSFDVYVLYIARLMGLELVTFPVDFGNRIHGQSKWATSIFGKYKNIYQYLGSIVKMAFAHYDAPHNTLRQLVRFMVTGVLTNIVNYLVFFLFLRAAHIYYMLSSAIGFMAGFIIGFIVNRSWTFSVKDNSHVRLTRFFILNIISLLVNMFTIWLFTDIIKIVPEISQLIAIAVSSVINFSGSKIWVFK